MTPHTLPPSLANHSFSTILPVMLNTSYKAIITFDVHRVPFYTSYSTVENQLGFSSVHNCFIVKRSLRSHTANYTFENFIIFLYARKRWWKLWKLRVFNCIYHFLKYMSYFFFWFRVVNAVHLKSWQLQIYYKSRLAESCIVHVTTSQSSCMGCQAQRGHASVT